MRLMLFIPMYNCAPQIRRTLRQLTPELQRRFEEVFVLDNGSTDGGPDVAMRVAEEELPHVTVHVAQNDDNYGLGGSHKVAFQRCIDEGYDGLVVFHGDDQGHLSDLMDVLGDNLPSDCVLGSRFMRGSRLQGYAPHRIAANVVFNGLFSAITLSALWDLGSGLNFYTRDFLEQGLWKSCADDLTFNYYLILQTASAPDVAFTFIPISWREDDQVSNAKLFGHGRKMLRIIGAYLADRETFLYADHSGFTGERTYTVLNGGT